MTAALAGAGWPSGGSAPGHTLDGLVVTAWPLCGPAPRGRAEGGDERTSESLIRPVGNMDNSLDESHLSWLLNYYLLTECGRKVTQVKESWREGIQVRLNFLGVWR